MANVEQCCSAFEMTVACLMQIGDNWRKGVLFQLPDLKRFLSEDHSAQSIVWGGMTTASSSMLQALDVDDEEMQEVMSDLIVTGIPASLIASEPYSLQYIAMTKGNFVSHEMRCFLTGMPFIFLLIHPYCFDASSCRPACPDQQAIQGSNEADW